MESGNGGTEMKEENPNGKTSKEKLNGMTVTSHDNLLVSTVLTQHCT